MAHLPSRILMPRTRPQRVPRAIVILLALAALLDLDLLARAMSTADSAHDALLMLFAALWIDLTLLCTCADLAMRTPRWSPLLSVLLLPLAGAACFAAVRMQAPAALAAAVLLPLLIALAGLLPWLRRARQSRMLALCWSAVAALSLVTLLNAA